ncbi:MAG: GTP-binding protein [Patescibacteria group bacterium]
MNKPPIVTILGHVDHGKTTLLEFLLRTYSNFQKSIINKEAGGITQKVRAFEITYNNQKITFIDTPGHEAFMGLRDRGAQIADIAILIIAADEGIKPQTKESIDLLLVYKIPFIVVLNKADKPNVDFQKVKQQLSEVGVMTEDWGGDITCVEISALNGSGISDLLEMVLLVSEMKELKFDPEKSAEGYILEAIKDNKKGILASVILQNGNLKTGDLIATSSTFGKIKFIEDSFGVKKDKVVACEPVIIGGFNLLPNAGETFIISNESSLVKSQENLVAKEILVREKFIISPEGDLSAEELNKDGYSLIIRADHIGSLEAIENILQKLSTEKKIKLKIIKADLGQITSEDIRLLKDTSSIAVVFNIKNQKEIMDNIKHSGIKFLESEVIYELEESLKEIIEEKEKFGEVKCELEVLAVFNKIFEKKTIGGEVKFGHLRKRDKILIKRGMEILGKGKILSIEKNKNIVDSVEQGSLCGLVIETNVEIEIGDKIVAR